MNDENYGFYSYFKPELVLDTLERILGEQTMSRVMRTYHERWRFDARRIAEAVCLR